MAKIKIMMIDDELDFCKLVKVNLELSGRFEVSIAGNGKEGLEKSKLEIPEVILLDIMMPNMDGFAVLKALKKNSKTMYIPVIMLTAVGDELSKLKAAALYDEKYLTKPVENEALEAAIKECLDIRGITG